MSGARGRSSRRAPKQARSLETREAILDAAEQLLQEAGRVALTMRGVMRRSGIGVGTFYDYFPSKESLLFAIEERTWAQVASAAREELALAGDGPIASRTFRAVRRISETLANRFSLHGFTLDAQLPEALLAQRAQSRAHLMTFLTAALVSLGSRARVKNHETAAFVVFAAVFQVTRAAVDLRPAMVASGEVFDEIATFATRYLFPDSEWPALREAIKAAVDAGDLARARALLES